MSDNTWCPLIKKDCVTHKCAWYTQVVGTDPNTGQEVSQFGCAIAWMPTLMIENSGMQRQTGAAVESFRNEIAKGNEVMGSLMNHPLDALNHDQGQPGDFRNIFQVES